MRDSAMHTAQPPRSLRCGGRSGGAPAVPKVHPLCMQQCSVIAVRALGIYFIDNRDLIISKLQKEAYDDHFGLNQGQPQDHG